MKDHKPELLAIFQYKFFVRSPYLCFLCFSSLPVTSLFHQYEFHDNTDQGVTTIVQQL